MERTLARVQAATGLVFALFLSVHLLALFASAFGAGYYDAVQQATGVVYRNTAYELVLLLLPLGVHAVVGVLRMRGRGGRGRKPLPAAARWHRYSAWFLLVVIVGHVGATRGVAIFGDVPVGFAAVSFAMWWMPTFFGVYYTLLALAGLYHGVYGTVRALAVFGVRMPGAMRLHPKLAMPLVVAGVLAVAGVASFAGALYPVADPTDNPYARLYRDTLGVELASPGKATP